MIGGLFFLVVVTSGVVFGTKTGRKGSKKAKRKDKQNGNSKK